MGLHELRSQSKSLLKGFCISHAGGILFANLAVKTSKYSRNSSRHRCYSFILVLSFSAFLPRLAVTSLCCHGNNHYAVEIVWYTGAMCYGFTLGF